MMSQFGRFTKLYTDSLRLVLLDVDVLVVVVEGMYHGLCGGAGWCRLVYMSGPSWQTSAGVW